MKRMARTNQDLSHLLQCERCKELAIEDGQEICPSCNAPTKFMSFKKRAEYEVEQWRSHKARLNAAS
jgi:rRNA maturation endonuclease Nob1